MNKQTAVKWLIDEIEKHYITNNARLDPTIIIELEKQAKAMFQEQIESAYKADTFPCSDGDAKQYYNETFKSE